ncbi:MAG: hypothetical protein JW726_14240 [Anaerolineales bacterium]|nr:hypothetical protein [Anaerolineales bacterium]
MPEAVSEPPPTPLPPAIIPSPTPPTDIPTSPPIMPTDTAIPSPTQPPPTETTSPTLVVETIPSPTVEPPSPYLPNGFLVDTHDGIGLTFFNFQGNPIAELDTPGVFSNEILYGIHIAGPMNDANNLPPVVYFTYDNGGALLISENGIVDSLLGVPNFLGLVGAPAQPILAFSIVEYQNDGLLNRMFIGKLDELIDAAPVLDFNDPASWAVLPLAVVTDKGEPVGIWYTTRAYGIGGDIIFEPRQTLSYLNLSNGAKLTYFGTTINPCNLSPDLTLVAYTPGLSGPITIDSLNDSTDPVTIPLLSDSDRGAGDAVFSPDNAFIAWKEGSGFLMADMPDFHATIRIAHIDGNIIAEIPESAISSAAGDTVSWVIPVGWLDNETLILEVRIGSWENISLMKVNFDGTGLAYLAPGAFAGFTYP